MKIPKLSFLNWLRGAIAGLLCVIAVDGSWGQEPSPLSESLAQEGVAALASAARESGDEARGALIFHTQHLSCTKCHSAGEGPPSLGPKLAGPRYAVNAASEPLKGTRLTEHLVESLLEPSKAIRPEYRGVAILTTDGKTRTGLLVRESAGRQGRIVLRDAATAAEVEIPLDEIEDRVDLAASIMPAGLVNLLADRGQFLDLVRYLDEIAQGGALRAAELRPDPALLAPAPVAEYEKDIDHAGFLVDWSDSEKSAAALARGEKIYSRVCVNCHGTRTALGSLPTALRFAEGKFKAGADPYAIYRTLTHGSGQMTAQPWMAPSQKYDVIHYLRETYLKNHNPTQYAPITSEYLAALPVGRSRGPEPSTIEPWRIHDYGPFLAATYEVGKDGANVARKGFAVRLDPGPGGVGRGRVWIMYELDTLRAAAVWTGENFIDWRCIHFDGSHGTHPRIDGNLLAATPTRPGWADASGSFVDPRPLGRDQRPYGPMPAEQAKFAALHHAGDQVVLEYSVRGTQVFESARLEAGEPASPIVTRFWWIAPHEQELSVCVAALSAAEMPTAAALVGEIAAADARLELRDGFHTLLLPANTQPLVVGVALSAGDAATLAARAAKLPACENLQQLCALPARNRWDVVVETRAVAGTQAGPFATDVLNPPVVNPWNAQMRLSGLDFFDADAAALCTWDGDVWIVRGLANRNGKLTWRRIASGMFQPLGLKIVNGQIYVGCRDRIVALHDDNGDGCVDRYATFNSDHQVTEHFHEFAMGLETDAAGNFFYAKSACHARPAVVPQHGTLLKVARDGSTTEIVARGFRAANGVCVEPDGTFFVTDQEGHWTPKNRINHVRPGGFYGNMLGYHDVTDTSDAAMEPPLAWITNAFDRSPAELLRVPRNAWSPLEGKLLELSYGEGRIHLVLPQTIAGVRAGEPTRMQGGLVQLPLTSDLPTGTMRGRFHAADGCLYTCGLFAWAGNRTAPGGFFRIRRTAQPLILPIDLAVVPSGLRLTFGAPLDRAARSEPARWAYKSWGLKRTAGYGSQHLNERKHEIERVEISSDGRQVTLHIQDFAPTWCYELTWELPTSDGPSILGRLHGTIHSIE